MAHSTAPRACPKTILIVDDFEDAREMYADYLAFRGYRVLTAKNGSHAIEQVTIDHPDLVLMDLDLPGMSGLQCLQALRANPALESTRIVALTGYAMDEDRRHSLAAGFDAFIPKPCLPEELVEAVRTLLHRTGKRAIRT